MVAIALALQPAEPRPNGLVSVLRQLPAGWERGVEAIVRSTPEPVRIGPCDTGSDEPNLTGEPATFEAVVIRQGALCSLLGRPDTEQITRDAAVLGAGWALSQELYDGAGTSNPHLTTAATALTAQPTVTDALSVLEAAAEAGLHGGVAVIHVPVDLAAYISEAGLAFRDGQLWRTQAGNLIAFHGEGVTMYATGEVWGAIGAPDARRWDNMRDNTSEGWADIAAMVVFDPATVWSVEIDAGS